MQGKIVQFTDKADLLRILKEDYNFEHPCTILDVNKLLADRADDYKVERGQISINKAGQAIEIIYRDFTRIDLSKVKRDGGGFTENTRDVEMYWSTSLGFSNLTITDANLDDSNIYLMLDIKDFYDREVMDNGVDSMNLIIIDEYEKVAVNKDLSAQSNQAFLAVVNNFVENYVVHGLHSGTYYCSHAELKRIANYESNFEVTEDKKVRKVV